MEQKMARLCYLCHNEMHVWRQNLSKLTLNHSKTTISNLLRKFLCDFQSRRNVDDDTNCICVECFDAIDEYDWLSTTAKMKEQELRNVLLKTEMLFMIDDKEDQESEEAVNAEFTSMDERGEIDCNSEVIDETENEATLEESANQSFSPVETREFDENEEFENEKLQDEDSKEDDSQDCNAQCEELHGEDEVSGNKLSTNKIPKDEIVLNEDVPQDQDAPQDGYNSMDNDLEFEDTTKTEYDGIENEFGSNSYRENASSDENSFVEDSLEKSISNPSKTNSLRLVKLVEQIEEMRKKTAKEIGVNLIQPATRCVMKRPTRYAIKPATRYQCGICDVIVYKIRTFRSHMRWHERFPGFTCHFCLFKLTDKESYRRHLELHTNAESKTQCVICEKIFLNRPLLRAHMVMHIEPYLLCDLCGKKFRRPTSLRDHRKTHLDIRPEKCIYCPKTFKTANLLAVHTNTHTQTHRPYSCSVCGLKFKLKDHMKRHERRHTENTKTIKCLLCESAFEHKFYLKQHMQRKHGVEVPHGSLEPTPDLDE